jgi:hypothetical protein
MSYKCYHACPIGGDERVWLHFHYSIVYGTSPQSIGSRPSIGWLTLQDRQVDIEQ